MRISHSNLIYSILIFIFYAIGSSHHSLWNDEFITLSIIKSDYGKIIPTILNGIETHPPLYPFLAKIFCEIFGYSKLSLRIFTSLLGAILFFVSMRFSSNFDLSKKETVTLRILLFLSPLLLYFSHELRGYSLLSILVILSADGLYKFVHQSKSKGILWSFWAVLAFHTHSYAVLFIFPLALFFIKKMAKKKLLGTFFIHCLFILLLCSPWSYLIFQNKMKNVNSVPLGYHKEVNLYGLLYSGFTFLFGFSFGPSKTFLHQTRNINAIFSHYYIHLIPSLIVLAALGKSLYDYFFKRKQSLPGILYVLLLSPIVIGFLLAQVSGLPFNVRYFLPGLPVFLILVAKVISPSRVTTYLLFSLMAFSYGSYYVNSEYHREDYQGVAQLIKKYNLSTYQAPYAKNFYHYEIYNIKHLQLITPIPKTESLFIINRPWMIDQYESILEKVTQHPHKKISGYAGFDIYHLNPATKL